MSNAVALESKLTEIEKVLVQGDLAPLKPEQRVQYVNKVCETMGLNPMTKPFEFIKLNGKIQLYAKKDATDQLRRIYSVSIDKLEAQKVGEELYMVKAYASMPGGRTDVGTGAIVIKGLRGEALANALMKAETKAKRRVTLSICGLGLLDETEVADAKRSTKDSEEFISAASEALDANDFTTPLDNTKDVTPAEEAIEPPPTQAWIRVQCPYDDKEQRAYLKENGFQWNKSAKKWQKEFDEDFLAEFPYEYELTEE